MRQKTERRKAVGEGRGVGLRVGRHNGGRYKWVQMGACLNGFTDIEGRAGGTVGTLGDYGGRGLVIFAR